MAYQVRTTQRPTTSGKDGTIVVLEETSGLTHAEIWPALGFNCFAWQILYGPAKLDLLYTDPQLFENGRPTRSGIPILFPFPNRIRDGRFTWEGKTYQLPLNDATGKMAIHGFVCRTPWRVIDQGSDANSAWVTGEFSGSRDAPDTLPMWPADYRIRVTYRLSAKVLRQEAVVDSPDGRLLPFGLGYHPYFRVPLGLAGKRDTCTVTVPARQYWELQDCLPTSKRLPVTEGRDLRKPKAYSELQLDDVLTDLDLSAGTPRNGLPWMGTVRDPGAAADLRLYCSDAFREMVLFTPSHREAICLEPYTCPTDAVHLQEKGIDAGWRVVPAGQTWQGVVEMVVV